jgi:adenylate cyclase
MRLQNLNKKLAAKGYPAARVGVGIHTGPATVGNLGGSIRTNYTAVGDTINVASRLESYSRTIFTQDKKSDGVLIISSAVKDAAAIVLRGAHVETIDVKGKSKSVQIHIISEASAIKMLRGGSGGVATDVVASSKPVKAKTKKRRAA